MVLRMLDTPHCFNSIEVRIYRMAYHRALILWTVHFMIFQKITKCNLFKIWPIVTLISELTRQGMCWTIVSWNIFLRIYIFGLFAKFIVVKNKVPYSMLDIHICTNKVIQNACNCLTSIFALVQRGTSTTMLNTVFWKYMHTQMYAHRHTQTHTQIHTHRHTDRQTHTQTYTHTHTHTHTHTQTHRHTHVHKWTPLCTYCLRNGIHSWSIKSHASTQPGIYIL